MSSAIDWIHTSICFHSKDAPVDTICDERTFPLPITIRLQLQYDENAGPLSWGLYHIDSTTTIYQQSLGSDDRPPGRLSRISSIVQTEYVQNLTWITVQFSDLDVGTYYFQLRDHSENAVRSIQLIELQGGKNRFWINQEGSIGGFYSVYFDVTKIHLSLADLLKELETGVPSNNTLIEAPTSDRSDFVRHAQITVEIFFDRTPTENSWMLAREPVNTIDVNGQGSTRQVIAHKPSDQGLFSQTFQVQAPGVYEFQLWDAGNDGFAKGGGWVAIWVGNRLAYASDGDFYDELNTKIHVR